MKEFFYFAAGIVGAGIGYFIGDYSAIFITLCIFMITDYVTGIIVATVFHNSPKTEFGKAESRECLKGVIRKIGMLTLVGIANQLDAVLNFSYVRDGVMFALMFNECLSILENLGLMGITIPEPIRNALEVLNKKGDDKE